MPPLPLQYGVVVSPSDLNPNMISSNGVLAIKVQTGGDQEARKGIRAVCHRLYGHTKEMEAALQIRKRSPANIASALLTILQTRLNGRVPGL